MRTTFLGLYGVDAVMPSHVIDDIVLRAEGHEAVKRFSTSSITVSSTLFYRTWKKYRYPIGFRPGGTRSAFAHLLAWRVSAGTSRRAPGSRTLACSPAGAADPAHANA